MFSLQPLVYPKAVGHVLSVDAVTTTGPMADAFFSITLVGGLLLALMLSLYVAVAARGPSGPDV